MKTKKTSIWDHSKIASEEEKVQVIHFFDSLGKFDIKKSKFSTFWTKVEKIEAGNILGGIGASDILIRKGEFWLRPCFAQHGDLLFISLSFHEWEKITSQIKERKKEHKKEEREHKKKAKNEKSKKRK